METPSKNKVKRLRKPKLCPTCRKEVAESAHTCPYSEDIAGDLESKCFCCVDCQNTCAADI